MTTTKRTDELQPGDVIIRDGHLRTIASTREATEQGDPIVWDVRYIREDYSAKGAWATANEKWTLAAPSRLDLAVQRAQELADRYEQRPETISDASPAIHLAELLDLFRAAR